MATKKQADVETKTTEPARPTSTPTHPNLNTQPTETIQEEVVTEVPAPDNEPFERQPAPTIKKRGVTAQNVDRETGKNTTDSGRFERS